jgi:hypothetical protein
VVDVALPLRAAVDVQHAVEDLHAVAADRDDALDRHLVRVRSGEHGEVAAVRAAVAIGELGDQHLVARAQRGLHAAGRDGEGLCDERPRGAGHEDRRREQGDAAAKPRRPGHPIPRGRGA